MSKNEITNMLIKYHNFPSDYSKYESIQGGKMEHLFSFSKKDGRYLYDFKKFNSNLAEEAFYYGKWTIKFHGSNGFITKKNNKVTIWERRDIGEKHISSLETEYLELNSFITNPDYKKIILPEIYNSNNKKHHYVFIKVQENSKMGKKLYPRIINLLKNINNFCQSIEIVGQKIQGNPYQFSWNPMEDHDYGIVFHSSIEIYIPELNIENLIKIAETIKIEGWVIYHKGAAFKLRTNMITTNCAFNNKDKTDILGLVY
jgi:hypothetical protein